VVLIYLASILIFSFISITLIGVQNTVLAVRDTFNADGAISSLIFGMNPSVDTVNMRSVQKFILSGDWELTVDKSKLVNFTAVFYTGPVDGANNHTHQLSNLRPTTENPILLSSDGSAQISGILNVATNGKSAWNDVNATITMSNGRTISIKLDDKDSQNHFMNQPIFGIIQHLRTN
jgi:hypothetical protein